MTREELEKIISDAIETEVESYEFYTDASERLEDPQLKELFHDLAQEELEHREYLQNFLESDIPTIEIDPGYDYGVAETLDAPRLSTDMGFADAIKLAIKREEEAMEMYSDLAKATTDGETQKIFRGLSDMEQLHKSKLEEVFVNVGFREVW